MPTITLRRKDGSLVYPNARVMVPEPEHAFWMDDARMNALPEGQRGGFMVTRRVFGSMPADKLVRFAAGAEVAAAAAAGDVANNEGRLFLTISTTLPW
jgi:hypothetical protein